MTPRPAGRRRLPLAAALAFGLATLPAAAVDRPSRIVSLNMCTDELLLRLVDRDRIASVTWLSRDPRTANMAAEARRVPANHGAAEEVLAYRPDLVVANRYTTRATVAFLRRAGIRVVDIDASTDLSGAMTQVRSFAAVVGEAARGETLVAEMERRLAAIAPDAERSRPGAFVLQPNGFTVTRGSLADDIMSRAGLDNLAVRLDLGAYAQAPLERIVREGADMLIVDAEAGDTPSLATAILDHPVLAKLRGRLATVAIPSRLWTCAGPGLVEAVERLRAAARALRSRDGS